MKDCLSSLMIGDKSSAPSWSHFSSVGPLSLSLTASSPLHNTCSLIIIHYCAIFWQVCNGMQIPCLVRVLGGYVLAVWLITHSLNPCNPPIWEQIHMLAAASSLSPYWLLRRWWMSLEVKSDEDTLEFDHVKNAACEGKRTCARMSVSVSPCAVTVHSHTQTWPHHQWKCEPCHSRSGIESRCYLIFLPSVNCW